MNGKENKKLIIRYFKLLVFVTLSYFVSVLLVLPRVSLELDVDSYMGIPDNSGQHNVFFWTNYFWFLLAVPLEELIFRGFLTFERRLIGLSIIGLIGFMAIKAIFTVVPIYESIDKLYYVPLYYLSIYVFMFGGFFLLKRSGVVRVDRTKLKVSRWSLYLFIFFSSIVFGLSHLSLKKGGGDYSIFGAFVIVLPQIWHGLVFSFVRLKFNLFISVLAHTYILLAHYSMMLITTTG